MKTATYLAFASSMLASAVAIEYTVATCAELVDVDDTTVTSLVITASPFECDEYTRFPVRNTMSLTATVPEVVFSNLSFKVRGELTVEPDVVFTGVIDQVKNGGVLSVSEGATATFLGSSEFTNNSIKIKQTGTVSCGVGCTTIGKGISYVVKKGGAVHNKGTLTFDGDATFTGNMANTDISDEQAKAGAISNTGSGTIHFNSKLALMGSEAEGGYVGLGGGIYNRGDIVVDGESFFSGNRASDGGAIYQTETGTVTFNGLATFTDNIAFNWQGGALFNDGGVVDLKAGSVFDDNAAWGSGDGGWGGAIYNKNGGMVTLTGSTTFSENSAYWGGAIYSSGEGSDGSPTSTTYPADTIFVDNWADNCPNVNNGDDDNCPEV